MAASRSTRTIWETACLRGLYAEKLQCAGDNGEAEMGTWIKHTVW